MEVYGSLVSRPVAGFLVGVSTSPVEPRFDCAGRGPHDIITQAQWAASRQSCWGHANFPVCHWQFVCECGAELSTGEEALPAGASPAEVRG